MEMDKVSKEYSNLLHASETIHSLTFNEVLGKVEKAHLVFNLAHLCMVESDSSDHTEPAT